jgi:hypothetical protein
MKKIITLELDVSVIQEEYVPYSAGIWMRTLTYPQALQDASYWTTAFTGTWTLAAEPVTVGSTLVDNRIMGEVASIDELYIQDNSFYWDQATQTHYIALFDYFPANSYVQVRTGQTTGFMSEAQFNEMGMPYDSYIAAVFYDPRLIPGSIDISEEVDDQKTGIFVFSDLSASIDNSDGEYDQIRAQIVGNEMRVAVAHLSESPEEEIMTGVPFKTKADPGDFVIERSGVIEDVDYSDPNEPVIKGRDPRENWTQDIGVNLLTTAEFADLPDNFINKRKPVIFGPVMGSFCIPLDKPATPTTTDFLICDIAYGAIQSTDSIYFDGTIGTSTVRRDLTGGEFSVNLSTGILTITNYKSGKAYFSGTVTTMTTSVEMILFILDEFENLAFISSNFNQTEIAAVPDYTTHVYIDEKGETVSDVIQKLCADIQHDMIEQGTILTLRDQNEERASVETILFDEITDNPAGWVNDRTDTVKTISVTYNPDHRTDEAETYYDDSQEQTAIDNNLKAVDKSFETNLTDPAQVAAIFDPYYARFVVESRTVFINRLLNFSAGLADFVTFKLSRQVNGQDKKVFERALYKIISHDKVNNTAEIIYYSDRAEPYLSPGLPAFATPAFGAPTVVVVYNPYSGVPAFAVPAFATPAAPGGATPILDPVSGSGYVAGATQQIGE